MRRGRWVGVAAAAVLVAGYGVADASDALPASWPGILTTAPPWAEPEPFPTVRIEPAPAAPQVLTDLADDAPVPDADRLAQITEPLLADVRLSGLGVAVLDAASGEVLLDHSAAAARTPASTLKLLTTTAALVALGADTRLPTRVVASGLGSDAAATSAIYLVGGGDVLLAADASDPDAVVGRAGLGDLARLAAAELRSAGVTAVRVALDDSAFSGPATAPGWSALDRQFVSPVAPLAVNRGIVAGQGTREADPALAAARTFAAALAGAGVTVAGDVVREGAPPDAATLAVVESADVADLVGHTLRTSDNDVAEVLARLVALAAGLPGDFSSGASAVLARLAEEGLDVSDVRMVDASGLSEQGAVPPLVLARLVALVTDPTRPDLLPVATGMPLAGLEGTLASRFDGASDAAAGVVRAKTGTLLTVVALAGSVLDADGRLLAFAVIADGLTAGSLAAARGAVDAWVNELAACGCS